MNGPENEVGTPPPTAAEQERDVLAFLREAEREAHAASSAVGTPLLAEGERYLLPHEMQAAVDVVSEGMQKKVDNPRTTDTHTELLEGLGTLQQHGEGSEPMGEEDRQRTLGRVGQLMGSIIDGALLREGTPGKPNPFSEVGARYKEATNRPSLATKIFIEAAKRHYSDLTKQLDPLLARGLKDLSGIEKARVERLQNMLDTYQRFEFRGGRPEEIFGAAADRGDRANFTDAELESAVSLPGAERDPDDEEAALERVRERLRQVEMQHLEALESGLGQLREQKLAELKRDLTQGREK